MDTNERDGSPLIRLNGVGRVFVTDDVETHALRDIDLDVRSGDYVSIAGPSGCGKTTLLSILGLLDSPTSGTYLLDGDTVGTCRSRVGRGCETATSASCSSPSI